MENTKTHFVENVSAMFSTCGVKVWKGNYTTFDDKITCKNCLKKREYAKGVPKKLSINEVDAAQLYSDFLKSSSFDFVQFLYKNGFEIVKSDISKKPCA